ncbi:MAG: aminoacyl-histidine dipeptidase [Treponema sp.]
MYSVKHAVISCCEENFKTVEPLKPAAVFRWFAEISNIPRGSGNEKAVSDFLVQFAKDRSLPVHQDSLWNVIIKKPASNGFEQAAPVILQGHMDMVCEKESSSPHNFSTDPVRLQVNGDTMSADGTTLGGDDGIAVAYILAILDSDDIPHPPIEALITTQEETGMGGAMAVDSRLLTGKRLLNIDSEEEGIFLASCAGGATVSADFLFPPDAACKAVPPHFSILTITIDGLQGGHSGMEINKQRANAIKLLGRMLYALADGQDVRLISAAGGSKHNAIAKHAVAVIAVPDRAAALQAADAVISGLQAEYRTTDKNLCITIVPAETASDSAVSSRFTSEMSRSIIDFLAMVPDGVQAMSMDMPGLVQTSLNNGILLTDETGVHNTISIRSSVKTALSAVRDTVCLCAKRCGGSFTQHSEYPAWEYAHESPLRDCACAVYQKLTGTEAAIAGIHAGLECGLLKKIIPELDALSFGPNLYDVHTPNESLRISSVERMWHFICALLKHL